MESQPVQQCTISYTVPIYEVPRISGFVAKVLKQYTLTPTGVLAKNPSLSKDSSTDSEESTGNLLIRNRKQRRIKLQDNATQTSPNDLSKDPPVKEKENIKNPDEKLPTIPSKLIDIKPSNPLEESPKTKPKKKKKKASKPVETAGTEETVPIPRGLTNFIKEKVPMCQETMDNPVFNKHPAPSSPITDRVIQQLAWLGQERKFPSSLDPALRNSQLIGVTYANIAHLRAEVRYNTKHNKLTDSQIKSDQNFINVAINIALHCNTEQRQVKGLIDLVSLREAYNNNETLQYLDNKLFDPIPILSVP